MIKDIKEILNELAEEIGIRKPCNMFVSTGFAQLDKILGFKLNSGSLFCLAAMPGMGKSTFMLDLLLNSATTSDNGILYFTNELTGYQIVEQLAHKLGDAEINKSGERYDYASLNKKCGAFSILSQLNITIVDHSKGCKNIKNILSFSKKPAMILIDGFEAISQDFEGDFMMIRNLCKSLNIPIIISMWTEKMQGNYFRPTLSDVYPIVAKFADSVWLLHRDSYFDMGEDKIDNNPNPELIICKNRNGEIGTIQLKFDGQTKSFIE